MVFSSTIFLFGFLPLVLIIYFALNRFSTKVKNAFLLVASSLFYYWGEQNMIFLMYGVILLNFMTALFIDSCEQKSINQSDKFEYWQNIKRVALYACVVICVGLLWYYKYWNFSIGIFNNIFTFIGINYQMTFVDKIILPLGISFYTFHVLSYTFDVYYGKMKVERNLLNFMTYVLMFPQLVAGPIVRYIDIQKQFIERTVTAVGFANGIRRFCFGLGKKILIANTVAKAADKIFALPANEMSMAMAWGGAICYTLQIYFDFSGYSDMAIGMASMFGFHYKENFNYPYIAKNVSDFWRRWHISLSTWLRDYVYIYMGGSKEGKVKYYANVLVVFLLSGLWHGANMTFVLWGLWYGVFIILEDIFLKKILKASSFVAHVYMVLIIVFGWVLFRADNVAYALQYWGTMLGAHGVNLSIMRDVFANDVLLAMLMGVVFSFDWRPAYKYIVMNTTCLAYRNRFYSYKLLGYVCSLVLFLVSIMSIMSSSYNPFIYFRF